MSISKSSFCSVFCDWKFGLVSTLRPVIADAGILERPAPDPLNWVAYNCPVLELNVRLLPV